MVEALSPGRLTLAAALFAVVAASADAQTSTPPPPAPPTAAPAAPDEVVLSRTDHSQTLITADLPLVLTKAGRVERALVRRAVFISSSVSLTRPAAKPVDGPQSCEWTHQSFLQRQVCISSMTGLFACTEADVQTLPDAADGEMRISDEDAKAGRCNDDFAPSASARAHLADTLKARAQAMFDDDQHTKVDPIFKAAAVTVRPGRVAP